MASVLKWLREVWRGQMLPSPTHNINIFALSINLLHVGFGDTISIDIDHVPSKTIPGWGARASFAVSPGGVCFWEHRGVKTVQHRTDLMIVLVGWFGMALQEMVNLNVLRRQPDAMGCYGNDRCHVPPKKRRGNGPTNLWLCDVLVFGES